MSNPESPEALEAAKDLHDKACEYLPSQARLAMFSTVAAVYVSHSETIAHALKLTIECAPEFGVLNIETREIVQRVFAEAGYGYQDYIHYKDLQLRRGSGIVKSYREFADVRDHSGQPVEPPQGTASSSGDMLNQTGDQPIGALESEVFHTFTQEKLDYLMSVFDHTPS